MNAAEQATSIAITSKIAAIVNLFSASFPKTLTDLNPWITDPQIINLMDCNSLDLSFHFLGHSPSCQCSSILMQIQFNPAVSNHLDQIIGIELSGYDYQGQQWQLLTIDYWQFIGKIVPTLEATVKLETICRQILELFTDSVYQSASEGDRVPPD
jgi:hypothetical protein